MGGTAYVGPTESSLRRDVDEIKTNVFRSRGFAGRRLGPPGSRPGRHGGPGGQHGCHQHARRSQHPGFQRHLRGSARGWHRDLQRRGDRVSSEFGGPPGSLSLSGLAKPSLSSSFLSLAKGLTLSGSFKLGLTATGGTPASQNAVRDSLDPDLSNPPPSSLPQSAGLSHGTAANPGASRPSRRARPEVSRWPSTATSVGTFSCSAPAETIATTTIKQPAGSISAVLPSSAPLAGGSTVTIHGAFLADPTGVTFGGLAATSFTGLTADSVSAVVPAGVAGSVPVVVTTSAGPSSPGSLIYTNAPIVTAVSPNTGSPTGGTSVTISGLQLAGATAVDFGTAPAPITSDTGSSITTTSPAGAAKGVVNVIVTNSHGPSVVSPQDEFTYRNGYWFTASDGGVFAYGNSPFWGSAGGIHLNQPVVGMARTPDNGGYWLVASDGGIFSYGNAKFYGSAGAIHLNQPIVGMAATPDGFGYWLVASDGGIFSYGDARFFGSTGNITLNKPIVGMASTPDGKGYWLVASDGGVFSFGDAKFHGSTGAMTLNKPVVGMASSVDGNGYWLVASDGGIFSFGDALYHGSTGAITLNKPVVGMTGTPDGAGYWLTAADGGVFSFGDAHFFGSTGNITLNKPIVGISGAGS